MAGSLSEPLTCSHQLPPGTARVSKRAQSNRFPSTMLCPCPSKGAQSRLAFCFRGRVRSPGRSICAKKVMVLKTGKPLVGSTYSIVSAS